VFGALCQPVEVGQRHQRRDGQDRQHLPREGVLVRSADEDPDVEQRVSLERVDHRQRDDVGHRVREDIGERGRGQIVPIAKTRNVSADPKISSSARLRRSRSI